MNEISPRTSRFAAISLLVLLILLAVFHVLVPVVHFYSRLMDEIELLDRQLARSRYLIDHEETIDEELKKAREAWRGENLFLDGRRLPIASANLREIVNDAIQRSGGLMVSSQEFDVEPSPPVTPVGLRLQMNGEIDNLTRLLYQLQSSRPLIFVNEFSVSSSA